MKDEEHEPEPRFRDSEARKLLDISDCNQRAYEASRDFVPEGGTRQWARPSWGAVEVELTPEQIARIKGDE